VKHNLKPGWGWAGRIASSAGFEEASESKTFSVF